MERSSVHQLFLLLTGCCLLDRGLASPGALSRSIHELEAETDKWTTVPVHSRKLTQSSRGDELVAYAQAGDVPSAKRLLNDGVDPNHQSTRSGITPLLIAIMKDHGEIVKLLIENGARLWEVRTKNGQSHGVLQLAAFWGSTDAAEVLLISGAQLDSLDAQGQAALHVAAFKGTVSVACLLLDHGASIDLPTVNNLTPLYIAARNRQERMVQTLLARGANVDKKSAVSLTPLMGAAFSNSAEIIELLVDFGADVNAMRLHGYTSLHIAALYGNREAIEALLKNGADKSIKVNGYPIVGFLCKCTRQWYLLDNCKMKECDSPTAMKNMLRCSGIHG